MEARLLALAAARAGLRRRQRDVDAGGDGQLGRLEHDRIPLPRERRDPLIAVVCHPRLVVEDCEQPPALGLAVEQHERRAHEPPPADAAPAPGDLQAVGRPPLEALELEDGRAGRDLGWQ